MNKSKFISLILILFLSILVLTSCLKSPPKITSADVDFNSVADIEKNLFDIIKLKDLTEEEASSVILALEEFNWKDLNEKGGKKFKKDFSTWIAEKDITKEEEITAIIGIMHNFSKKDYVKISTKLAGLFEEDMAHFIKALSKKRWNVTELAYAFHDLSLYKEGNRDVTTDFNEIVNSDKLTKEEKFIGLEFIDTVSSCDT